MGRDQGASASPSGSHPSGHAASGVDGASRFDPSRGAVISACGKYRYVLERRWSDARALDIIMLNPSTADAALDDPTIRRCVGFAKREELGGIRVMNLFAYRATSPKEMLAQLDPWGRENSGYLRQMVIEAARAGAPVLAAWGAHGVRGMAKWVQEQARHYGARLVCLGKTNGGHPRHPLYVRADQPFVDLKASAIETGTATTAGRGPEDESAARQGDAQ